MKILVHPDSVPMSLEECIDNLKTYLDDKDSKEINLFKTNPFCKEKIGAAIFLKSVWSLTDEENCLVQWFKKKYRLSHPDDISGLILHCLYCDIKNIPRGEKKLAEKYLKSRIIPKRKSPQTKIAGSKTRRTRRIINKNMKKLNQDQRVYFKIKEGVEGWATVAGDYDIIIILKPETPLNSYSHIYVTRAQIVDNPNEAPVVNQDVDGGL